MKYDLDQWALAVARTEGCDCEEVEFLKTLTRGVLTWVAEKSMDP